MKRIFTLCLALLFTSSFAFAQTQASGINFQSSGDGANTSLKINWTSGTSTDGRIVVIKNATGSFTPSGDISSFGANANFNTANDLDASTGGVAKVVYAQNGGGTSVTVSNLVAGTQYYVQVYEYTGLSGSRTYLTTTSATNPLGVVFYTADGSFNTPIDVTTVTVQAWGGGAGGGTGASGNAGSGGGGGAYAAGTATVAFASNPYPIVIGSGGSAGDASAAGNSGGNSTFNATSVVAAGGSVNNSGGVANGGTSSSPSAGNITTIAGGNGAAGDATAGRGGGGGGSSASPSGASVNGTGNGGTATGGAGGDGPDGDGGKGGNNGVTNNAGAGTFPGGGGGGRGDGGGTGGAGAPGLVIVSFKDATQPSITTITRQSTNPVASPTTSVIFRVTFSEDVVNVDHTDFTIAGGGATGTPSATNIITPNRVFDITVSSVAGNNQVLNLNVGTNNITDISNNPFSGTVTTEETYTVDTSVPIIDTAVVSPSSGTAKVGDVIVVTATANGETGLTLGAGTTVNGQTIVFNESPSGTYTFTYTVANGNANWATGALPINLILSDGVNNSAARTTYSTANTLAGDANAPSNQNTVLAASVASLPGGTVTLAAGAAGEFNWLAPTGTTSFVANGTTITTAAGNATSIVAPSTAGAYKLFITDAAGNVSSESTATVHVFTQASTLTFAAAGTPASQINFNWTNGTGTGRVVIMKTAGAVYSLPNGSNPTPNLDFSTAPDLNGGTAGTVRCVFNGTGSGPITVTNLSAATAYTIEVYEYAGSNVYLNPALTGNRSTPNGTNPNTAATGMVFTSISGTSMSVQFSQGNGTSSVLVAREGNAVSFTPTDGVSYTPDANFTTSNDLGSGNKILAIRTDASSGTPINVSGLTADRVYHFAVFEMNGTAGDGSENYSAVNLVGNRSTEPLSEATGLNFTGVGETGMTLNWTNGDGDGRIVIMRQGSAVSTDPTDYTSYTASGDFNFNSSPVGSAIGAGYLVYDGTGSSVTLTELLPGQTYHFQIFEYNNTTSQGAPNKVYLNPGAPTAIANQATNADATAPTALTVGTVASTGNRVVPGFYNSTNTGIDVTVPLDPADGTLDGGTIQIQVQNTLNTGYVNISGTGLVTISNANRLAGTRVVSIASSDLEAAFSGVQGFAEGQLGNATLDTRRLQFTAVVRDLANNPSLAYTASSNNIDVDQTLPTVSPLSFNLYFNKGLQNANREVILLRLSEDLYNSSNALVSDNTVLVNAVNKTYGGSGWSVDDPGVGTNDVDANYIRYESDGGANSADNTILNTRLIWVESNNNNSNWSASASPATKIQYVPFGSGSSAAEIMRDAAGNELGTVAETTVSDGDATPPTISPLVLTLFPRASNPEKIVFTMSEALSTPTTANAVTGFTTSVGTIADATYTEASPGVCPCTITLTRGGATPWTSSTTVSYALTGNVTDLTTINELAAFSGQAVTVETVAPNIVSVSIPNSPMKVGSNVTVSITTANDDGDDPIFSGSPTIGGFPLTGLTSISPTSKQATFTVTEGGTNVAAGTNIPVNITLVDGQGNTSSTFTTAINQAGDPIDANSPTITSITNSVSQIFEGALTQTVTVVYSEPMSTSIQPVITINGGGTNWGAQTASGGTNGWVGNTYTATFTHNGTQEVISGITTSVGVGGAQDAAGNPNLGTATSSSFNLDTQKPTVSSITVSPSTVSQTNNVLTVTVNYSEDMRTSTAPSINFSSALPNLGSGVPRNTGGYTNGWKTAAPNDSYIIDYTHNLTQEELNSLTVSANGARDDAGTTGNLQTVAGTSSSFSIDTRRPTVVSINRTGANQYINSSTVSYTVTFSEQVTGVNESDFTPVAINGTVTAGNVQLGGVTTLNGITYTVTIENISGDGDIRLDVNGGTATITDNFLNALNVSKTGDQIYTRDATAPAVTSIVPIASSVNGYASTVNGVTNTASPLGYTVTFSEPVSGVDPAFADFRSSKSPNSSSNIILSPVNVTPVGAAPTNQWQLNYNYTSGTGTFKVDYNPLGVNYVSGLSGIDFLVDPPFPPGSGDYYAYDHTSFIGGYGPSASDFQNLAAGSEVYVFGGQYLGTVTSLDFQNPPRWFYFTPSNLFFTSFSNQPYTYTAPSTPIFSTTGTITATSGLLNVTGSGTSFTSEVLKNDLIFNASGTVFIGIVSSVVSNNLITLKHNARATLAGAFSIRRPPQTVNSSSITDRAGNPISQTSFSGTYANFCKPEPASSVSAPSFVATPANKSITVNWTDVPSADRYLVMLRNKAAVNGFVNAPVGTFPVAGAALQDGVYFNDDTDLTDGLMILNINQGVQSATFNNINSGADYSIIIYPYTLDNNNIVGGDRSAINYNLNTPATINSVITGFSSTTSVTTMSVAAPIASTVNSATGQAVFQFRINEDALASIATDDNAPFKFNTISIIPGATNALDWAANIAGAQLTNSGNGVVLNGVITGGSPATSRITFSGLSSAVGSEGYVADNSNKVYTLNIWLNTTVTDNTLLNFRVNSSSFATFYDATSNNQASSQLSLGSSTDSGSVTIQVTATALAFTTQPTLTPGGGNQYVLTNFGGTPVFKAVDGNGNVDVNYNGASFNATLSTVVNGPTLSQTLFTPTSGVYTLTGLQYNNNGTGSTAGRLTATVGAINSNAGAGFVSCIPITVIYSPLSTVTNGTGVARILSTTTAAPGTSVFAFTYNDDGGIGLGDGADTKIDQIKITPDAANQLDWGILIAGATLTDGTNTISAANIDATGITFSGPAFSASTLSTVTDAVSAKLYTLNIWLNTNIGGLRTTADQDRFVFSMSTAAANLTLNAIGSQAGSVTTASSAGSNGFYEVDATRLIFSSDFSGPLTIPPVPPTANAAIDFLVNTSTATQSLTNPIVRAVDIYGNTDTDITGVVTTTATGGMLLTNPLTTITNGQGTFAGTFEYQAIGNGTLSVSTAITNRVLGPISPTTNPQTVNVKTGTASRINSPAVAAANVSSVTNASPGSTVFTFSIADDPAGTPTLQNDGNPTLVNAITITGSSSNNTITDWVQAIAGARLEDANNTSQFVELTPAQIGASTLTFTGIPTALTSDLGYIADGNGSGSPAASVKTFNLRIWLKSNLSGTNNYNNTIDGLRFGFEVLSSNVSTVGTGTSLVPGLNANTTNVSTPVDVDATQLDITSPSAPTTVSISSNFSGVVAQARDANANRDLDFNGVITALTNTTNATMINGPTLGTTAFVSGVYNFNTNFQFTSGSNNDNVTLALRADNLGGTTGTNCGTNAICSGISPTLTLLTSFESSIQIDPTFTIPARIPYLTYQEATDIQNNANSYELLRLLLVDGSRGPGYIYGGGATPNLNTGTDSGDLLSDSDNDGAATVLTDLTVRIFKPSVLRRIALYANGVEVAGTEIDVTGIGAITAATASYDFVWSGSNLVTASDNSETVFSIRVSFRNTAPQLVDRDDVQGQLIAATVGNGSKFFNGNPANSGAGGPYIGGTPPNTPGSLGLIDVVATSLDFVTAPSAFAGTEEPLGPSYTTSPLPATSAAIVHARDKFALLDLDFSYPATSVTVTGANALSNNPFVQGVLNLDGMIYRTTGDGTLSVQAGGLNSATVPADNIGNHIPGQAVDVIHVNASPAAVATPSNLKGGTPGAILMGITFTPQHSTAAEPVLKRFVISFKDNPYQTATSIILKNFKVRIGSTDVTSTGATVTTGSSTNNANLDLVIVDWAAGGVDLFDVNTGSPAPKTFFLVADIDVTAKLGTPTMIPTLIDAGYNTATDKNIIISKGTARASVNSDGSIFAYTFASTRPPVLLTGSGSLTRPYNGQLNVNKNLTQIKLEFDIPVWSLDGKAELINRANNAKVADLVAVDGNFTTLGTLTPTANPITFNINWLPGNSFIDDALYYVTIKKGTYDNLSGLGEGISDDGFNYYGGISSNAILFFKISSPFAPKLSFTKSVFSNLSTGSFQTTFDQRGTAYYLVVPAGSAKPTNGQIDGSSAYGGTVVYRGNYPITLVNAPQITTFSATLTPNTPYDIWIYAKNDADPINIPTNAPYSGVADNYSTVTGTSPTLRFTTPILGNIRPGFQPDYTLCPDSYFTLTDPIIIGEVNLNDFAAAGTQDFNLLLPSGFEFDGVTKPTVSLEGTSLGTDFTTPATVNWVNKTIVNISYQNTGGLYRDKIVITNLRIRGTSGSNPGNIRRFAGNASIGSLINLATIANLNVSQQKFTNSYSTDNDFTAFGFASDAVITAIPDNYIDRDANIFGGIRLIPQITPANDYGITFFSGTGVTNDVLSLEAVALNTAFDITMTHTDLNGCISENSVQYVVYDHETPISDKLGSSNGTEQALNNPNFPAAAPTAVIPNASLPRINYKDLAGYKLLSLKANLPTNTANQIMSGASWESQVVKIPKIVNTITTDPDLPSSLGFTSYNEYQWDYSHILNVVSETSGGVSTDPYDNFRQVTANGNTYWTGGTLGKVVFTGTFQSTADLSLIVPFRQEVELFIPAIPLIEVDQSNQPVKGTTNYCEFGGSILINGFPAAAAGRSTGTFTIVDAATDAPLQASAANSAFVDNGNGTATIFPYLLSGGLNIGITNGYKPIKVKYTYQDDNSPAVGTGELIIRITPNPIPNFTTSTLCEDIDVIFTDTSAPLTATGVTIDKWEWNFADASSPNNTATTQNPIHIYSNSALYTPVTLDVTTNIGCKSTSPKSASLQIGGTPAMDFSFNGVSIKDAFAFTNNSQVSANDSFKQLDWNFGDNSPIVPISSNFNGITTKNYTTPGEYTVNLKVTSTIGCVNTLNKKLIVLDQFTPTPALAYDQSFETTNANWQASNLPFSVVTPNPSQAASSWAYGNPTFTTQVVGATNTTKMWKTNLNGSYNPNEKSALYSPSFDLSQMQRPMISFNSFVQFINSDGVVIEYSTDDLNVADPSKKWEVLGKIGEGVDWINEQNIAAKPGRQVTGDFGWSGLLKKDWRESKYALSNEPLKSPVSGAKKIVFRFALGSVRNNPSEDGFAMDNFRLGERTRTVLLESFANVANTDASEKVVNDYIRNNFNNNIGTDVVKLNYHVGFPGLDPFNQDNQADPSSRALYYEIAKTPKSVLDGNDGSKGLGTNFNVWGEGAYNSQTLQLANADIIIHAPNNVNAPPLVNKDGITFEVTVNAKTTGLVANRTILHAIVVEQMVAKGALSQSQQSMIKSNEDQFAYIVKKMLPSAAGTRLPVNLPSGSTQKFGPFTWKPDPTKFYSPNTGDLAVVAFLQDEVTRTVYQSEIVEGLNDPASTTTEVITGIESILPEQVNVFPNPANKEFVVELPGVVQNDIELQMIDQIGRLHPGGKIPAGKNSQTVDVSELAEGIYILQIGSGSNGAVRKKVMVVRKE